MANLLLTERCVRSCPYCFAKRQMKESSYDDILSWEDFMYVVDFFELSKHKHLALLGGEPTLHPDFVEFVLYLYRRNFDISVFTSAILSDKTLSQLQNAIEKNNIPANRLFFLCNVNHPSISPEKEIEKQINFLEKLGKYCSLGFNIFDVDFDLSFIVEYINKFQLRKNVRIGLTHPIFDTKNKFISSAQMKIVAERLIAHYPLLEKNEIKLNVDCGFPLCIFDDNSLGKLYKLSNGPLHFSCGTAIDIGTHLDVWSCFPLSSYEKRSLYDFSSFNELQNYYSEILNKIKEERKGIFEKCNDCLHLKTGLCAGGCGAYVLQQNNDAKNE